MAQSRKHPWAIAIAIMAVFTLCFALQRWIESPGAQRQTPATPEAGSKQRIISLAPSVTETLFALGLGDSVVGVTRYCDFPPEALDKARVGGYYDPNYEAMIALRPDLVILLPEHETPRRFLENQGINVLTVNPKNIDGIMETIRAIGQATDRPGRADTIANDLRQRIDTIAERTRNLHRPSVMITIDRNLADTKIEKVFIAGTASWYNELIDLAGGVNAYTGAMAFPSISAEGILKLNPNVVIDMFGDLNLAVEVDPREIVEVWQSLDMVAAVQNDRVHVFTDDFAVIPGPRVYRILEKMARAIHPEIEW